MTKSMRIVVPLFFMVGCAAQKMALRAHEPVSRLALAICPMTQAPLEQPRTELPHFTVSIWSLASAPVIFVSTINLLDRRQWFKPAEILQMRHPSVGLLDLSYPGPATISMSNLDPAKKHAGRLLTAEARLFSSN